MCHIKTEIHILKDPKTVWKCLTDFEAYPTWNPFLTKIESLGDKELRVEFQSKTTFKPHILKMEPSREFRWVGKLGGVNWLFKGEHYFILKDEKKGTTLLHGEHFTGILAWILWPFIRNQMERNFISMNEALKKRVETQ
jgi:hypothetical protein